MSLTIRNAVKQNDASKLKIWKRKLTHMYKNDRILLYFLAKITMSVEGELYERNYIK